MGYEELSSTLWAEGHQVLKTLLFIMHYLKNQNVQINSVKKANQAHDTNQPDFLYPRAHTLFVIVR